VAKNQLDLSTPLEKIGRFYLKREDLNPSGSVKDRAMISQLAWAEKQGNRKVAISSSGNAGISAAFWAPKFNLEVFAFVSPQANRQKLARLKELGAKITVTAKPISDCFKFCSANKAYDLRQSLDPRAILGYRLLGQELEANFSQAKIQPEAIFFPVSSGATLRGVAQGLGRLPRIFLVQPANHCPLAQLFDQDYTPEKDRLADGLVARIIPHKDKILNLIDKSRGGGVIVQNEAILKAHSWLKNQGVITSFESAVALAGAQKIIFAKTISPDKPVIILLTGKFYRQNDS